MPVAERNYYYKDVDLWDREADILRLLIELEAVGVRIDEELCKQQLAWGRICMSELIELIGYDIGQRSQMEYLFLNVLGLPVLKSSERTGEPSFDKYVMEGYDEILQQQDSEVARQVLAYRGWQKTCSSNYSAYLKLRSPYDGKLHPHFKPHGTRTGRFSCETPNLQQIPRTSVNPWNGKLRSAFIPTDAKWRLFKADYSQLEFRLQAGYSQCLPLIEVFNDPERDVFTEMSKSLSQVSPVFDRYYTKQTVYSISYGAGIKRLCAIYGVSADEAKYLRDQVYYKQYPELKIAQDKVNTLARNRGYVKYWTGRRRHFPDRNKTNKAFNSLMQGGAAEVVKDAMLRVYRELVQGNENEFRMFLQIHDEIDVEVRRGCEEKYLPRLKEIMEDMPFVRDKLGVQLRTTIEEWK